MVNNNTKQSSTNMRRPYHEENVKIDQSLIDENGHRSPLFINIVMKEDEREDAVMECRIYFPSGYKTALESAIRTDMNDSENMQKPSLVKLDMQLYPTYTKTTTKPAYKLWLGSFYVYPAMLSYKAKALPHERNATKGIGRIVLCHAIRAWLRHGARLWPDRFPRDINSVYIGLKAESDQGIHTDKLNVMRRAFYGMGIRTGVGHTKLLDYYKQLGFNVKRHTLTGVTPMQGRAEDVLKMVCLP